MDHWTILYPIELLYSRILLIPHWCLTSA
jgi:hypothetical protein